MAETSTLLPILSFVGIMLFGVAFLFVQYKQGAGKASTEVIATYREQVIQLKDQLAAQAKRHSDEISVLTSQVGELRGLITAKDEQIKELKDLLLEKSPEMAQFYKRANEYFITAEPIMKDIKNHIQLCPVEKT